MFKLTVSVDMYVRKIKKETDSYCTAILNNAIIVCI